MLTSALGREVNNIEGPQQLNLQQQTGWAIVAHTFLRCTAAAAYPASSAVAGTAQGNITSPTTFTTQHSSQWQRQNKVALRKARWLSSSPYVSLLYAL